MYPASLASSFQLCGYYDESYGNSARRARGEFLQAFQEIERRMVTENLFSQFCYKTLPNQSHLWLFKQQFCMQMALSGTAIAR